MSRTLDGTYTTVVSNIPTNASARYGAIGVVGHMSSGVKYDSAGTGTNVVAGTDWEVFGSSSNGTVYQFDNFGQVTNLFGVIGTSDSWTAGTFSGTGSDTSGYDQAYNLIRQLELIYLANPNARVYAAVLTGTGTSADTAAPTGLTEALSELTKYDDISYVVGAGMDLNANLQSHVNTASNETNKAERIYVGGTSLQTVLSGTNYALNSTLLANYTANQNDNGRTVFVPMNIKYKFQSDSKSSTAVEVGGNFLAGYVAGYLSGIPEQQSLLRQNPGFIQVYNNKEFRWSKSDLTTLIGDGALVLRHVSGRNAFSRALTFADPSSSSFTRITKRRIVDRVTKEVRISADGFVGKANTAANRLAMQSGLKSKLSTLASLGIIAAGSSARVFVEGTDIADGVVRVSVIFRPITEIEFVEILQSVEI